MIKSKSKKIASGGVARPSIERMTKIWAALRDGNRCNAFIMAAEFECSRKTIYRDLEFMRDRIGLPIEYNKQTHTFKKAVTGKLPWWL